ncbi:MAG TPA: DUF4349 domain-containing protein [Coriobacteriia bacterium]|nr:DUF4349 domain-containing protein [Coriobacteriia bacterium]
MWSPKARRTRTILVVVGVTGALIFGAVLGGALVGVALFNVGGSSSAGQSTSDGYATEQMNYGVASAPQATRDAAVTGGAAESKAAAPDQLTASTTAATAEPMMVKTSSMDVRVDKVGDALDQIRGIVGRFGAQISDYSVSNDATVRPIEPTMQSATPSSAYVTIRVPAKNLDALRAELSKVGDVLTESSSASDVTQQYVDMDARLKNLKAEEGRLRDFLTKTNKVSELLQVESELSRVRGDIESMQAQLDYLSKQVSLATLTLNLSEPGAVVRPQGIDWGFRAALTRGFQGAASVVTFLITATIALLPLLLVGMVVFLIARALVRRARKNRPAEDTAAESAPDEGDE